MAYVTTRDLDKLITKTYLTPLSKKALKNIRRYVISGKVGEPEINEAEWSVGVDDMNGAGFRVTFSFNKRT